MTKLLDKAVAAVKRLPSADQDEIARAMLQLASGENPGVEDIDPAHLADVLEGLAEGRAGKFASAADVEAAFRRFVP